MTFYGYFLFAYLLSFPCCDVVVMVYYGKVLSRVSNI